MKFQAGRVRVTMATESRPHRIICLSKDADDYGLYIQHFQNYFGTPLALRGTKEELEDFLRKVERE